MTDDSLLTGMLGTCLGFVLGILATVGLFGVLS